MIDMKDDANIVNLSDHRPVTVHLLSYGQHKVQIIKVVKGLSRRQLASQ